MKLSQSLIALSMAAALSTTAHAVENLTGETASPGGSIHLSMAHLAEAAAAADVANIQVADLIYCHSCYQKAVVRIQS